MIVLLIIVIIFVTVSLLAMCKAGKDADIASENYHKEQQAEQGPREVE